MTGIYRHRPPSFVGGTQPYAPRIEAQPTATEAVTEDKWHQPLSEPRRSRPALLAAQQQAIWWSGLTPPQGPGFSSGFSTGFNALPATGEAVSDDRWHQPLSEPRRSFGITASLATAALVWSTFTPPAQPTTIRWFSPLSTPVFPARVTRGTDLVEPVSTARETVSIDRWIEGLSTPVWPKQGLGAANQAAYFAPPATIDHTSVDRWYQNLANPVWPPRGLRSEFQQTAAMPLSESPETVTEDRWHQPFSLPVWPKPGMAAAQQQAYAAPASEAKETVTVDRWLIGLSTPLYAKTSVQAASQQAYTAPVSEAAERVSVDRWLISLSNPVWARPALLAAQQSAFWWSEFTPTPPAVVAVSGWGQPFVQPYPAVRGLHASQQQALAPSAISEAAETVSVDRWLIGLSLPVWARPALLTASQTAFFGPTATLDHTSVDRWYSNLSIPVWARAALATGSQRAFFSPTATIERTTVDRWQTPFSTPVWPKPGLNATEQQVYVAPVSEAPETTTVDRWHAAFSLPVWPKRGLYATEQQHQTAPLSESPETTTVDRWYQPLSIPVRRRSVPVYQLQAQIAFTTPPVSIGWFQPLSIPTVLVKIGLHESFRPASFLPFPPFTPSPDREIIGRGGVRLIYGKAQDRSLSSNSRPQHVEGSGFSTGFSSDFGSLRTSRIAIKGTTK